MKYRGQSLVEFAAVIPLLVVLILGIIEFSMYWRAVNTIQKIASETSAQMAAIYVPENANPNPAVNKALSLIIRETKYLGDDITFVDKSLPAEIGTRPFSQYKYESQETRDTANGKKPVMTVIINYRNPSRDGIMLQLDYQYRTILIGAEIPLLGGKSIVIIPRDIEIISKKIQQYIRY